MMIVPSVVSGRSLKCFVNVLVERSRSKSTTRNGSTVLDIRSSLRALVLLRRDHLFCSFARLYRLRFHYYFVVFFRGNLHFIHRVGPSKPLE